MGGLEQRGHSKQNCNVSVHDKSTKRLNIITALSTCHLLYIYQIGYGAPTVLNMYQVHIWGFIRGEWPVPPEGENMDISILHLKKTKKSLYTVVSIMCMLLPIHSPTN